MSCTMGDAIEAIEPKEEGCGELFAKSAKGSENRASISSVDSSISLSYDAVPFTPRGSLAAAGGSSTDDECGSRNGAAEQRRSSGGDSDAASGPTAAAAGDSEEPFEAPDAELTQRIVDQVEYYFSDENIVKDAFLLKHVRRNKEGYVSLKLIASFKRVKHIARDWRVVRVALERSAKLEINEAGTKLRRKEPLPLYDQTTPSRTVVALNVPPERATIEAVAEMFRACGEIALVRVLRPGNPIPADVRPFYNKHPQMHDRVSALVEFVRTESAHNALNREPDSLPAGLHVLELNAPPPAKKKAPAKKSAAYHRAGPFDDFSSSCASGSEPEDRYRARMQRRCSSPHAQPPPAAEPQPWAQRRWSRDSGSDSPASSFSRSRSNSGVYYLPEQRRVSVGWDSGSDSYGSCRSRSNSNASIPEIFQMRRYSLPRKEPACCCCGYPKCESSGSSSSGGGRRYSLGKSSDDGYSPRPLSRCTSGESSDGPYRKESVPEYYPLHRAGGSFERRSSLSRPGDGAWSRSSSLASTDSNGRRLSDSGYGLVRQRSFGSMGNASADAIVRLPRGPDGGRGFQRELIEYPLPE